MQLVMQTVRGFDMIIDVVTGKELETKRESMGLTREELARELKVSYTTVFRWEKNERTIPSFLDLALETIQRNLEDKK